MTESDKEKLQPPRFWVVYLGCLGKPRTITEIAEVLGYSNPSSLYRPYKEKPLVDYMLEKGYLELKKEGKKMKYLARVGEFVPDESIEFFEEHRGRLFGLEKLKSLFRFEEFGAEGFRKFGFMFWQFIISNIFWFAGSIVSRTRIEKELDKEEAKKGVKEKALGWFEALAENTDTALDLASAPLNREKYVNETFKGGGKKFRNDTVNLIFEKKGNSKKEQ